MFEFKEDADGQPRFLEINPRIWGSYPLTRVSNSGHSIAWFAVAWNRGNPDAQYEPHISSGRKCRMQFAASDLLAAFGYLRRGKIKRALRAFLDLLDPVVRDGLWEFRDMKPAFKYYASLFSRNKE